MGFKFSRCRFSINASSSTARSSASRTITGTSANPSNCDARQRRSPAISSNCPPRSRTISGWTMPCSRIESASSRNASSENFLRGCNEQGRIRSKAIRRTRSPASRALDGLVNDVADGAGAVGFPTGREPPIKAPNPRPKAGFAIPRDCRREGMIVNFGPQLKCAGLLPPTIGCITLLA